jgi:hypothetical protein
VHGLLLLSQDWNISSSHGEHPRKKGQVQPEAQGNKSTLDYSEQVKTAT